MNLWVRSQDKTQLGIIVGVILVDNELRGFTNHNHYYFELGTYKTKERALEVLDEIQNILKPKYILDSSSIRPGDSWVENGIIMRKYNANVEIKELSTFVYEMPAE